MIVTIVSDSTGDSALKASEILDAYLPRIGRRSWTGHVSKEGLLDIQLALRKVASRGTAIACHMLRGTKNTTVLWTVGRRNAFGPAGEAPVSWSRKKRRPSDRTRNVDLLAVVVALAVSFHDLGKLSAGFQKVLATSVDGHPVAQPVRHEFLSLLLLRQMIMGSRASCDHDFLKMLSDPLEATEMVIRAWMNLASDPFVQRFQANCIEPTPLLCNGASALPDIDDFPIMRNVAAMVATHHRLFRAKVERLSVKLLDSAHVTRHDAKSWKDFLIPCDNLRSALDAPSGSGRPSWAHALAKDATRCLDSVAQGAALGNPAAWTALCAHYGRLALMLGDHDGSARKRAYPCGDALLEVKRLPYANTTTVSDDASLLSGWLTEELGREDKGEKKKSGDRSRSLADTWDVHTHKARRSAIAALGGLLRGDEDWPCLEGEDIPEALLARAPSGSRFQWQDNAVDTLRDAVATHADVDGRLLFLISGTGTGKTVAAPKLSLAAAREGRLRLNVCHGLRSLTLQAGDEYLGLIGFSPSQAAVVIGSQAARLLHEADQQGDGSHQPDAACADDLPSFTGTDAETFDDADMVVNGISTGLPGFAERVVQADKAPESRRRLLASPVLVCTVDTLASVTDATGGRHLGDAIRVATADLILDEFDSYEAEDLVALTRLVEFAAYCGRSVTAVSATPRTEHAEAVRNAYALGRRLRSHHTGIHPGFLAGWFSESTATVKLDSASSDPAAFRALHTSATANIMAYLASLDPRRRAVVIDVADSTSRHDFFEKTLDGCVSLHHDNCIRDPATGKRVSVGFVRWNRISSSRAFAAHLLDHDDMPGTHLVVACHHSRFALAIRDRVDRALARMLSRKPRKDGRDPLLEDPLIRGHLDSASEDDVVVIISTTPLLEAGRDLDADWAIAELSSERAVIQLAGRVRRHREWNAVRPNVGILSVAFAGSLPSNAPLAHPGVETPLRLGGGSGGGNASATVDGQRTAAGLFDIVNWEQRLDAAACLAGGSAICGRAEAAMLRWGVLGQEPSHPLITVGGESSGAARFQTVATTLSVAGLESRPEWHWDDAQARRRTFRRGDPLRVDIDFRLDGGQWMLRDEASISSAKAALKTGQGSTKEWQRASPGRVEEDWVPKQPLVAAKRLLFPESFYNIEQTASEVERAIESRGSPVSVHVARDLRMLSLAPVRKVGVEPRLYYHPWLGGNHSRLKAR